MIIWTGRGWLVLVVGFASLLGIQLGAGAISGNSDFYTDNEWMPGVALFVAAAVIWVLSQTVCKEETHTYRDHINGEMLTETSERHSLFFMPVSWWPAITAVLGVIFVVVGIA